MAEVLGVVAAATQLAGACLALVELMAKIKGATSTLLRYQDQFQELHDLSLSISQNPLLQTDEVFSHTQSLLLFIQHISLEPLLRKGLLSRTWGLLKKDQYLAETSKTLEQRKSSLSLIISDIQARTLYDIRANLQLMSDCTTEATLYEYQSDKDKPLRTDLFDEELVQPTPTMPGKKSKKSGKNAQLQPPPPPPPPPPPAAAGPSQQPPYGSSPDLQDYMAGDFDLGADYFDEKALYTEPTKPDKRSKKSGKKAQQPLLPPLHQDLPDLHEYKTDDFDLGAAIKNLVFKRMEKDTGPMALWTDDLAGPDVPQYNGYRMRVDGSIPPGNATWSGNIKHGGGPQVNYSDRREDNYIYYDGSATPDGLNAVPRAATCQVFSGNKHLGRLEGDNGTEPMIQINGNDPGYDDWLHARFVQGYRQSQAKTQTLALPPSETPDQQQ